MCSSPILPPALPNTHITTSATPSSQLKALPNRPPYLPSCRTLQLPYTDAVLQEALRLHPPLPFLMRRPKEDIDLGGGKLLPK